MLLLLLGLTYLGKLFGLPTVQDRPLQELLRQYSTEIIYSSRGSFVTYDKNQIYLIQQPKIFSNAFNETFSFVTFSKDKICMDSKGDKELASILVKYGPVSDFSNLWASWNPFKIEEITTNNDLIKYSLPSNVIREVTYIPPVVTFQQKPRKRTLIIFTTCNQLATSIITLQQMIIDQVYDYADLLIVDDHSVDGTVNYLRKRGFAVFDKVSAKGLTDSWNTGYKIARLLGYSNVLLMNNDVILTKGSLRLVSDLLEKDAMLVPMTTDKGAGHNPSQSVVKALSLKPAMNAFIDDHFHAHEIQSALQTTFARYNQSKLSTIQDNLMLISYLVYAALDRYECKTVLSKHGNKPRFNGYAFAINIDRTLPAAFNSDNYELFDPSDKIVGQEDKFMERLLRVNRSSSNDLLPRVPYCIFWYHFKSATVRIEDAKKMYKEMQSSQNQSSPKEYRQRVFDAREDIRWYHPETSSHTIQDSSSGNYTTRYWSEQVCSGSNSGSIEIPNQLVYSANHQFNLFRSDDRLHEHCVFPSFYDELLCQIHEREDGDNLPNQQNLIVVAFAISDPARTPAAGDIFTAYELAEALQKKYSNLVIKYLPRGPDWYDLKLLQDVDILVSMLDNYDLSKVLIHFQPQPNGERNDQSHYTLKSTLITIGWMRNWFHRWLNKPFIGNYDLLLTSSELSLKFIQQITSSIGLQTLCVHHCPTNQDRSQTSTMNFEMLSNSRVYSTNHIHYFPIATSLSANSKRSQLSTSTDVKKLLEDVDYLFTGSYHKQPRKIMEFDPRQVHEIGHSNKHYTMGIIGDGWEQHLQRNQSLTQQSTDNLYSAAISNSVKILGRMSYQSVKESYQYVKIVVDDANHVTSPFAALNSRVFDALATGALVISNCQLGMMEFFGEVLKKYPKERIPVYTNNAELTSLLQYYLNHEKERIQLVNELQEVVLQRHSYQLRAERLEEIIGSTFDLKFVERIDDHRSVTSSTSTDSSNSNRNTIMTSHATLLDFTDDLSYLRRYTYSPYDSELSVDYSNEILLSALMNSSDSVSSSGTRRSRHLNSEEMSYFFLTHFRRRRQRSKKSNHHPATLSSASNQLTANPNSNRNRMNKNKQRNQLSADLSGEALYQSIYATAKLHPTATIHDLDHIQRKAILEKSMRSEENYLSNIRQVGFCVGIRTVAAQAEWLPLLLRALIVLYKEEQQASMNILSEWSNKQRENNEVTLLSMQLFVTDTESDPSFQPFLLNLAQVINAEFEENIVQIVMNHPHELQHQESINPFYGYDRTDELLDVMLHWRNDFLPMDILTSIKSELRQSLFNQFRYQRCDWILFTNGDNMYNSAFLKTITPFLANDTLRLIAWDFVTHHPRGVKLDTPNQPISIALSRGSVDLGSVVIRSEIYQKSHAKFLPQAMLTGDLFARDYFLLKQIEGYLTDETVQLIHQTLLFHQ